MSAPIRSLLACIALFSATGGMAIAAAPDTPDMQTADAKYKERNTLVHSMANMTLSILQDQKKPYADREATMKNGIADMVDIDWIAKFVLGNAWRNATDEQRNRYTRLYGTYLVKMYLSNFAQSTERKVRDIKVLGIADSAESTFVARTEVDLSTNEQLSVDYLVREKNDTHKIIDITIEGVSLLATHRAEFSNMAANKGVEGVIATLEQRVKEDRPAMVVSMQSADSTPPHSQQY